MLGCEMAERGPKFGRVKRNTQGAIERLLTPYELWKSGENEWRCVCPFHEGATNASQMRVKSSGYWKCFTCGAWGDLERLVMLMEGLTYQQAKEYVGNLPTPYVDIEGLPVLPPYEDRLKPKDAYPLLSEAALVLYRKHCPIYLTRRGFDEKSLQTYEIGYDYHRSRIVLPVRDVKRKLVGITLRLDFDGTGPKYWHDHFDKSLHLYGFHLWREKAVPELYLVEGQLDAVRMYQLGLPAVAILGSSISEAQVELLRKYARCEKIVLAFDNDDAGYKAAWGSRDPQTGRKTPGTVDALLRTQFRTTLSVATYPGKDPGDLRSAEQIDVQPWVSFLGDLNERRIFN